MAGTDWQGILGGAGDIAGLGLGIAGALGASQEAKKVAASQRQIAMDEMAADQQRRTAMELASRRQSMQNLRMNQRARSMALSQSTSQGSQFGSGIQGAIGSISGQASTNQLGISQNLEIGEKLFDINRDIDIQKMDIATHQGREAEWNAIGGLGKGLGGALGGIGKFMMF